MSFIEKQWKLIFGAFAAILVVGLVIVITTSAKLSNEKKSQENFFLIEKKYSDYKTKKAQAAQPANPKEEKVKPVADFAAELVAIKKSFADFLSQDSNSKAGQMAALYYSEILLEEKNKDLAKTTLLKAQNNDSGLVNTLVQQQLGQVLADLDLCNEAIAIWQKVIDRKEASFLHNEIKIQQALCYQKTNDSKKAEEILTNIANQKSDGPAAGESATAKEAAKYLRLIQYKKVSGT
ncbi:MAG: hypothetical protein WA160_03525 [Pseudobdellovibrio sp.]